jgi:hypothetical protein
MVNVRRALQENLDTARQVLATPTESLENKDLAGSTAAELYHALHGPEGGQRRAQ